MQPLAVKGDPRVKVSDADLEQQYAIQQKLMEALHQDYAALQQLRSLRAQLKQLQSRAQATLTSAITKLDADASALEGGDGGPNLGGTAPPQGLARLNGNLAHVYDAVSLADAAPADQAAAAADQLQQALHAALARWEQTKSTVTTLNQQLQGSGLPIIDLNRPAPPQPEDEGGGDEP